jgi:hypothetical protein
MTVRSFGKIPGRPADISHTIANELLAQARIERTLAQVVAEELKLAGFVADGPRLADPWRETTLENGDLKIEQWDASLGAPTLEQAIQAARARGTI